MKRLLCVLLVLSIIPGAAVGYAETLDSRRFSSLDYFGTICTLTLYDDFADSANSQKARDTWAEICACFAEIESSISLDIASSDATRFALAAPGERIEVSRHFYHLILLSQEMHVKTGGMYNPGVALLVDLWGFSPRFLEGDTQEVRAYDRHWLEGAPVKVPDDAYIQGFTALAQTFPQIEAVAQNGRCYVTKPADGYVVVDGVQYTLAVDFGGIGKGYACDLAYEILVQNGYEYGFVSAGGSSMRFLGKPTASGLWSVGIRNPLQTEDAGNLCTIGLSNTGLSTSGTYINSYELRGHTYHHIIDPLTGCPARSTLVSASVMGDSAAVCDAMTTALIAMGTEKACAFVDEHDVCCLLVFQTEDGLKTYTTMEESMFLSH